MQRKTRSLLEELESVSMKRDSGHLLESRAHNIITSAINLLNLIYAENSPERAALLERRLFSAIKNRDTSKFTRSVKKKSDAS